MKNQAFTLIELIAVIVILSLIALVIFPAVTSTLNRSKEDAYNNQKEIIVKAAKMYYLDHVDDLYDSEDKYKYEVNGTKTLVKTGLNTQCKTTPSSNIVATNNQISIQTLIEEGYIADEELVSIDDLKITDDEKNSLKATYTNGKVVINQKTNKPLEGTIKVTWACNTKQYVYDFVE